MTTTRVLDIRDALNAGNLNNLSDGLRAIKVGNQLGQIQVTFTALTDVAAQDITTSASKAAITALDGITLQDNENLPPIGVVAALRTVAGTMATHGTHVVGDVGTTPLVPNAAYSGVARLSADGKTLTFQAGVTGFVLWYYPKPHVDLDTTFAVGTP